MCQGFLINNFSFFFFSIQHKYEQSGAFQSCNPYLAVLCCRQVLRSGFISKLPETLDMMYHSSVSAGVEAKVSTKSHSLIHESLVSFAPHMHELDVR